jgi:hypothetical protein
MTEENLPGGTMSNPNLYHCPGTGIISIDAGYESVALNKTGIGKLLEYLGKHKEEFGLENVLK